MTGNIGVLGGCAEGVGKAWHSEAVAYPYDEYANVWFASIKSDRWAHCVLNYPNVKREEIGCWPRDDELDGKIPNIRGIFWQGSDWFNQLTNINKEIEAIKKLELRGVHGLDHHAVRASGPMCCCPIATHFERHDVALPWYKGHYYIHRPKVIEPHGRSRRPTSRCSPSSPTRARASARRYNPRANARLLPATNDDVDEAYLRDWWDKVRDAPPGRHHVLGGVQEARRLQVQARQAACRLPRPDREGQALPDRRRARSRSCPASSPRSRTGPRPQYGYEIPTIPKWIEPWESLNSPKTKEYPVPPDHRRIRAGARTRSSTTSPGCARPTSRR